MEDDVRGRSLKLELPLSEEDPAKLASESSGFSGSLGCTYDAGRRKRADLSAEDGSTSASEGEDDTLRLW